MSLPVASRKADFQTPPRAFEADGHEGQVAVLAVTTTAIAVDLTQGFSQAAYDRTRGKDPKSPSNNYLAIISDVAVGVIFGPTLASVTSGNVPAIATTGSLSSNVYVGVAKTCWLIPASTGMKFLLQPALDKFIGIVGSGNGVVRLYQISPSDA